MSKIRKHEKPEEFTLTRRKLISRFGALGGKFLTAVTFTLVTLPTS